MSPLSQLAKSLRLVRKNGSLAFEIFTEHFECKNSKLQIFFKPDTKIEVGDIRDSGDDPEKIISYKLCKVFFKR